ncbi:S8 family serine peptidase [Arenibaculum pallidiluteum]|uniref:S8 family serine peptidase n=1 Tax=Arenibaculum pallidiluteum TaxID=2812559 RepID=UPI001A97159E|nr:S8 family serine peptidase [Arenibaculum pallidiluteum]
MARGRSRRSEGNPGQETAASPPPLIPGTLITFRPDAVEAAVARLQDAAGVRNVAFAADFAGGAVDLAQTRQAGMTVFNSLGVAVADLDTDQESAVAAVVTQDGAIATVEPEPVFFAFAGNLPADVVAYLQGYRDAVNHLCDGLVGPLRSDLGAAAADMFQDTNEATWGLIASRALESRSSGRGVRVAVLDTGLDLDHPDFRGRQIVGQSFIPGQQVQDDNGHGTHCIGTACGARSPAKGPRYGIAHEAEIYVGKVLSDQGSSLGRSTLAGIEWAITNGCHIVSMSLGGRVEPGQSFLNAFETPAREAMRRNTLIIAAAGNDSDRSQNIIRPVGSPANCPSIMAVAAVDRGLRPANFSNGSVNADGRVDISGPGVAVYSSAPDPAPTPQPPFFRQWAAQYDTIAGTSMATPHVAGIAALLRQENPSLTAAELWRLLTSRARPLSQPVRDVGAGLVQA